MKACEHMYLLLFCVGLYNHNEATQDCFDVKLNMSSALWYKHVWYIYSRHSINILHMGGCYKQNFISCLFYYLWDNPQLGVHYMMKCIIIMKWTPSCGLSGLCHCHLPTVTRWSSYWCIIFGLERLKWQLFSFWTLWVQTKDQLNNLTLSHLI